MIEILGAEDDPRGNEVLMLKDTGMFSMKEQPVSLLSSLTCRVVLKLNVVGT